MIIFQILILNLEITYIMFVYTSKMLISKKLIFLKEHA